MNITFEVISNIIYGILILASVPLIILGIDLFMKFLREKHITSHNKLDIVQLIIYVTLILVAVVILFKTIKTFIKIDSIEYAVLTLIGSLVTVSSTYLSSSVKNLIPFSL